MAKLRIIAFGDAEINEAIFWANEITDAIAIRIDKKGLAIGHTLPPSRVWEDGYPTEEVLEGTACIRIDRPYHPAGSGSYAGEQIYAISGQSLYEGNDPNEIIVKDATVEAIWLPVKKVSRDAKEQQMTKLRVHAQNDPTLEEVEQRLEELRLLLKDSKNYLSTWEQVESEYNSLIIQKLRLELASMAINQPRTWGI